MNPDIERLAAKLALLKERDPERYKTLLQNFTRDMLDVERMLLGKL